MQSIVLDNDVFVIEHTLPPHNDVFTAPAAFFHYEGWGVFKSKEILAAQLRITAVLLRKTGRSRPLFAASLHEAVIYKIVQLFRNYKKDIFAQLIFSTHDTSLLNRELFRRDQVWFTQLNKDRATDLYSLVEIKDVRKSENLAKGYVSGKYGAIPMLNHVFFQKAGKDGEE